MAPLTHDEQIFSPYLLTYKTDHPSDWSKLDWSEVGIRRGGNGDDRSKRAARAMWYHIYVDQGWEARTYAKRKPRKKDNAGAGKKTRAARKSNYAQEPKPETDEGTLHEQLMVAMIRTLRKARKGVYESAGFWEKIGKTKGFVGENNGLRARLEFLEALDQWN
jgi:hypothetical protein